MVHQLFLPTILGRLCLSATPAGLGGIAFVGGGQIFPATAGPDPVQAFPADTRQLLMEAVHQLREYLAGRLRVFSLPLAPVGTPFQLSVWREIAAIPYGMTASYGELARRLGSAGKARAVGAAAGANPLPLCIPCHRVIGADGALTGFSSGLEKKQFLLSLERSQKYGGSTSSPHLRQFLNNHIFSAE